MSLAKPKVLPLFQGLFELTLIWSLLGLTKCTLIALGPVRVVPTCGGMTRPRRVSPRCRILNDGNLNG